MALGDAAVTAACMVTAGLRSSQTSAILSGTETPNPQPPRPIARYNMDHSDDDPSDHSGETLPLLSLSVPMHLLGEAAAAVPAPALNSKSASSGRSTPTKRGRGQQRTWQTAAKMKRAQHAGGDRDWAGATVEDFIQVLHRLPTPASAVEAVGDGLAFLDSRAAAALFKGLAKGGMAHHATELFDHLRALDRSHELSRLCDVFTYTTMISQCSSQHQLQRALELVTEMRGRGVALNVHAYSALLNVCLKSNELRLAIEVRDQMLGEGLSPSIVTYNTLCEIYAKAARSADAVGVFDVLRGKGMPIELRTLNAIMTACNSAGQHLEALRVYEHILMHGLEPLAVTLSAAVTAYAGCGQLDAALKALQQMARRGLERPVSTFAAVLAACEALGRWDVALEVMAGMERDGVRPNIACYVATIGACLHGGQRAHAEQQYLRMRTSCAKVDPASCGALLSVSLKLGHLNEAMGLLDALLASAQGPDAGVLCTAIDALWGTGVVSLQQHALRLLGSALNRGLVKVAAAEKAGCPGTLEVVLDPVPPHTACLLLLRLLRELRELVALNGAAALGRRVLLRVAHFDGAGAAASRGALSTLLRALGAPMGPTPPSSPSGSAGPLLGPLPSLLAPSLSGVDGMVHLGSTSVADMGASPDNSSSQLSRLSFADAAALFAGPSAAPLNLSPSSSTLVSPLNSGSLPSLGMSMPLLHMTSMHTDATDIGAAPRPGTPGGGLAAALHAAATAAAAQPADHIAFDSGHLAQWLLSDSLALALVAAAVGEPAGGALEGARLAQLDAVRANHAQLSLASVQSVEMGCFVNPQAMSTPLLLQRSEVVEAMLMAARRLGLPRASPHDAAMFFDRACCSHMLPQGLPPLLLAASCLALAAEQASLDASGVPVVLHVPSEAVAACSATVRSALAASPLCVSALRVLNVLLERLGCTTEEMATTHVCGAALRLLDRAAASPQLVGTPPSTLACSALYTARLAAGLFPAWPQALADLTGVDAPETTLELVVHECLHLLAAL